MGLIWAGGDLFLKAKLAATSLLHILYCQRNELYSFIYSWVIMFQISHYWCGGYTGISMKLILMGAVVLNCQAAS